MTEVGPLEVETRRNFDDARSIAIEIVTSTSPPAALLPNWVITGNDHNHLRAVDLLDLDCPGLVTAVWSQKGVAPPECSDRQTSTV